MELLAKVASLEAQVVALQASEAKLTGKVKGVTELHNLAVNMANDDNARLQEEIQELTAENEKLQCQYELAIQIDNKEIACLKEEIVDLKYDMENELYTEDQVEVLWEDARAEGEEYKAENEKLFKFITGGGETSDVEKIITEKMSKEFIDSNQEHWDQMELFQQNVITIINCKNCKYDKSEFYNKSGNSWCPRCKGLNCHED